MIKNDILFDVLEKSLSRGGYFSEIFIEKTAINNIKMIDSSVDTSISNIIFGAGIRIFVEDRYIYSSTNNLTEHGLLELSKNISLLVDKIKNTSCKNIVEKPVVNLNKVKLIHSDVSTGQKIEILKLASDTIKNHDSLIKQAIVGLYEYNQNMIIANSDGLLKKDQRVRTRLLSQAVASDGCENQVGYTSPGRSMGYEMFSDEIDIVGYAKKAATQAVTMLKADYCKGGKMTVAIDNGFGGVIFHEACGHSLEATSIAKGNSEFAGKLGEKIASDKVNAIDDGTIENEWGSINIDDEGHIGKKNILIENGILKGYLVDKFNSKKMGMDCTGSSRRQDYSYPPTSRMTNTYIANGNDKNEDIIASMDYGLYAKTMGGGSVNPVTGEFNFSVLEGYIVKNGKISEPVRGASLIGRGSEILKNIDMVGNNLSLAAGVCGSTSGNVPTNVGQPLLRVSSIIVGGR